MFSPPDFFGLEVIVEAEVEGVREVKTEALFEAANQGCIVGILITEEAQMSHDADILMNIQRYARLEAHAERGGRRAFDMLSIGASEGKVNSAVAEKLNHAGAIESIAGIGADYKAVVVLVAVAAILVADLCAKCPFFIEVVADFRQDGGTGVIGCLVVPYADITADVNLGEVQILC